MQVGPQEIFGLWVRRVATPPRITTYWKRPLNLAVRKNGKDQEVNTPVIIRKARSDNLPEESGCNPTLDRVDQVAAYRPTE